MDKYVSQKCFFFLFDFVQINLQNVSLFSTTGTNVNNQTFKILMLKANLKEMISKQEKLDISMTSLISLPILIPLHK